MRTVTEIAPIKSIPKHQDFSLVVGGPLYQLWLRAGLVDSEMGPIKGRVIAIVVITWLPLFILSMIERLTTGSTVGVPFLYDMMAYARFLFVLPLLVCAELWVHQRIGPAIEKFVERDIVTGDDVPRFNAAVESAARLRNSWFLEIGLIVLVLVAGNWVWRNETALGSPSWYASPDGTQMNRTLAGYWLTFVSVPIFQFIILRWYARFLIWFRFLWQVSRLDLQLIPTHPDRVGGLGFLSRCALAFGPILFAQGMLLSAFIANQIMYSGRSLAEFKVLATGLVILFVFAVVSPLCVFVPKLCEAKRIGLANFGSFASFYVKGFDKKWIIGINPAAEEPLGSGDIQSLADLENSYGVVKKMKFAPFGVGDLLNLAAITAAPLLPLTLFIFSLEELFDKLVKIAF